MGGEPWLAPWIGRKSDEYKSRQTMLVVSLFFGAILFMMSPFNIPLLLWLLVLIGLQFTATALTTLTDATASDVASHSSKVTVMTAYSLSIDLGAAIGPMTGYLLNVYIGTYAAYWAAASVLLLISIVWIFRHRTGSHTTNLCNF